MAIDLRDYEKGAPFEGDYGDSLDEIQERLSRLLVAGHVHGAKGVVVVEGWDASGKGGSIQRLVAKCDPRSYRVWPIAAPTDEEKSRHYMWRFWKRLPAAGQVAIFDRSWYGRVLVERIEGMARPPEWRRAFDEINEFEAQLVADGTALVKLFFHVTPATQEERFRARLDHPWKRWKISSEDLRNRRRRDEYLAAMEDMFARTDTRWAPWTVIDGNDKKAARIASLTRVADALTKAFPADPPPDRPEMVQLEAELRRGQE